MQSFDALQDAYLAGIRAIRDNGDLVESVQDPSSVGSLFGKKSRDFREIRGHGFTLTNPRHRIISIPTRGISLGFSLANFIWVMCGRRDVDSITFYNARGRLFSDDGEYYESAFGDRIFGRQPQWGNAKRLLQDDRNTRRALIPLFAPTDLQNLSRDTPCASSLQLMIRGGKLDALLHMRSQSAVMVFPYDLFLFTMLQEVFSSFLTVPLGMFTYLCNSFHYYLEEEELVARLLDEEATGLNIAREMVAMDRIREDEVEKICLVEAKLRDHIQKEKEMPREVEELPDYWRQIMLVLWSKGRREHGKDDDASSVRIVPVELI